jgi:predicted dehydrogenase
MRRHAVAYQSMPELARLVAVADVDRGRAEAARETFGLESAYANPHELFSRPDIDVVGICTRPNTHAQLVIDALRAGKHVLCEKPMAHTLAEADEIVSAAERHPEQTVSFLYQWRTDPSIARLRRFVEEGHLGRPLMADVHVRATRDAGYYALEARRESWAVDGGGVLIVVAIHQLDALISVLGDPVEVSAQMDTFLKNTEGEDTLVAWIRFRSGALATFKCTVCAFQSNFKIEVLGENASVRLDWMARTPVCAWTLNAAGRVRRRELQATWREGLAPSPRRIPYLALRAQDVWNRLSGRHWQPPHHWFHTPTIREFLEAVKFGRPLSMTPREARRSLELTIAIYQSALHRTAVRLPLDDESPVYRGVELQEFARREESVG